MANTGNLIDVALLNHGDFIDAGMVIDVHRPLSDFASNGRVFAANGPVTVWEIDYVATPDDDAPVLHLRVPAGMKIEAW